MSHVQASPELEALIVSMAPSHFTTTDAPNTWAKLKAWRDQWDIMRELGACYVIPVWDGGSEQTIYSSPRVNYAFRAWHDHLHLSMDAAFDAEGERRVAERHMECARKVLTSVDDLDMLWIDTWGQFEYYLAHGENVDDQSAFVGACLEHGLDVVILSGVTY